MSKYNPETTRIFYQNADKSICVCCPTGALPVEVVAVRDLPAGAPYWIKDFKSTDNLKASFPDLDFFDSFELDEEYWGDPHGVALGFEEWYKQQPEGTPGT